MSNWCRQYAKSCTLIPTWYVLSNCSLSFAICNRENLLGKGSIAVLCSFCSSLLSKAVSLSWERTITRVADASAWDLGVFLNLDGEPLIGWVLFVPPGEGGSVELELFDEGEPDLAMVAHSWSAKRFENFEVQLWITWEGWSILLRRLSIFKYWRRHYWAHNLQLFSSGELVVKRSGCKIGLNLKLWSFIVATCYC